MRPIILIILGLCCLAQQDTLDSVEAQVVVNTEKIAVSEEQIASIVESDISSDQDQLVEEIVEGVTEESLQQTITSEAESISNQEEIRTFGSIDVAIDQLDLEEEVEIKAEENSYEENVISQLEDDHDVIEITHDQSSETEHHEYDVEVDINNDNERDDHHQENIEHNHNHDQEEEDIHDHEDQNDHLHHEYESQADIDHQNHGHNHHHDHHEHSHHDQQSHGNINKHQDINENEHHHHHNEHDHHHHEHHHEHHHDHHHHHHHIESITLEESPVLYLELDIYDQPYLQILPDCSELFNNKLWNEKLIALLPPTKQEQLLYSLILTQLPSIPIFFILLLTIKGSKNLQRKSIISNMISFSFGSMLGDVFFHMLPTINQSHDDNHDHHHDHHHEHEHNHSLPDSTLYILGGIIGFIIMDFLVIKIKQSSVPVEDHDHDHGSDSAVLFLFSDFLHNFTDGIAIGATFAVNIKSGISTTLAILFHEVPHEIGDFAYLLKRKHSMFKILLTQIITSAGCFLGAYFSYQFRNYSNQLVAFTCGSFIYVAFDSILPEMKSSFKVKPTFNRLIQNLISIALGLYTMHIVGQLE